MNIVINILGYEMLILGRKKPPGPHTVITDNGTIRAEDLRQILRIN